MLRDPAVNVGDAVNLGDAPLNVADLLNAISVKLPPFWLYNIETCFFQTKSQFHLKGVSSSQTKFDYIVQSMSEDFDVKILDLVCSTSTEDPYQHLKDRLLPMNDYARCEAIHNLSLTGDLQPSTLMSRMLGLLPS